MPAARITFDQTKPDPQKMVSALRMIRDGVELLDHYRSIALQTVDGDTAVAANFDQNAFLGAYSQGDYADANTAAQASFQEIDSLWGKLFTDGNTSNVKSAIYQACAKHGV